MFLCISLILSVRSPVIDIRSCNANMFTFVLMFLHRLSSVFIYDFLKLLFAGFPLSHLLCNANDPRKFKDLFKFHSISLNDFGQLSDTYKCL